MDGSEIAVRQVAMEHASKDVRLPLADGDVRGFCRRHRRMDVVNEAGCLVLTLPFRRRAPGRSPAERGEEGRPSAALM